MSNELNAMNEAMKAAFDAMPTPAPEPEGDEETTVCEWCGERHLNDVMTVVAEHWLCPRCDGYAEPQEALAKALEKEQGVLLNTLFRCNELMDRAKGYRASLR